MKTLCVSVLAAGVAIAGAGFARMSAQATPAKITVTSSTLKEGQTMPVDYTSDGKNVSPPLAWSGAPASTKQFALILDDPNAGRAGMPFVHWVVYKIPGTASGLPEGIPAGVTIASGPANGAIQGISGFGGRGRGGAEPPPPVYRGPAPPAGSGVHNYTFTVYALDTALDLQPGMNKMQLLEAMAGHIVGQGQLITPYQK